MAEIIRIFDRAGAERAEITAKVKRSWILNDEGDCTFELSTRDSKAREEIVQYGNLVLIEHDQLPDWAGVIDLDPAERQWRGGSVVITAYSLERLLKRSDTPTLTLTGSAGSFYRQIIDYYNMETDLIILPGEIWLGGPRYTETLGDSCYVYAKKITTRSGYDWNISHRLEGGKLKLYANLFQRKGQKTGRLLFDGREGNIEKTLPELSEAGPIYNVITGYSDGSTSERLKIVLRNEASVKLFGARRTSKVFSGVTNRETLTKSTQAVLDSYCLPFRQTAIDILNKGGIYPFLDTGNLYDFHLSNAGFKNGAIGFDGEVKLFSMEYAGTPDKVKAGINVLS